MFHNLYSRKSLVKFSLGIILSITSALSVSANVKVIEDTKAQTEPTGISVITGKSASINFQNDETIIHIKLSDLSNNVFSLNAPIESGEARSVYLSQIKTLDIPGTTTTSNPNLFITTTNSEGEQKEYEFLLHNYSQGSDGYRIAIQPTPPPPAPKPKPKPIPKPQNTIQTDLGEATPSDVLLGLDISIQKGRISENDPIVFPIREFIAQTMNDSATPAEDVAKSNDIPLALLQKFGSLGLQEDAKRRLTPLPGTLTLEESSQTTQFPEADDSPRPGTRCGRKPDSSAILARGCS